jgi:hypothetical protein
MTQQETAKRPVPKTEIVEAHSLTITIYDPTPDAREGRCWTVEDTMHTLTLGKRFAVKGVLVTFPCGHEEFCTDAKALLLQRCLLAGYTAAINCKLAQKSDESAWKTYHLKGQGNEGTYCYAFRTLNMPVKGAYQCEVKNDEHDEYNFYGEEIEVMLALSEAIAKVRNSNRLYKQKR